MKIGGDGIVGIKVYAFGSILFSNTPSDVDLVVVFDPAKIGIDAMIEFRRHLCRSAGSAFETPFDVCLLTEAEVRNNRFLEEEHAVLIYG